MSKTIQIRNVPDALHRVLKARAAKASMSLSEYLLGAIKEIAEKTDARGNANALAHAQAGFVADRYRSPCARRAPDS